MALDHDDRPVSRGRFSASAMQQLQSSYWGSLRGSRDRIERARQVVLKARAAPLPKEIEAQGFSGVRFDGPESQTVPLHLLNAIASAGLELKRYPIGQGLDAESVATRLEQWGNAAMDTLFARDDAADLVLIEGEAASIVQLCGAHLGWGKMPDIYQYESDTVVSYNPRYARDRRGRSPEHAEYGGPDDHQTTKHYSAAKLDWMGRHFPLEIRLLSRLQQVPINPRLRGGKVEIDGLLVRTRFSRTGLIRDGWRWPGMRDGKMAQIGTVDEDATNGTVGWSGGTAFIGSGLDEVTLYEAWICDEDGPFAAFSVEGRPTTRVDDRGDELLVDGVLDLKSEWGLERLPISYTYGLRWAHPDPDLRSVQFPLLLEGSWAAKDTIRAAMTYHCWATSFMGWAYKPDPAVVRAMTEAGLPLTVEMKPMALIPIPGDVAALVHAGTGRDALALYASHEADARREGPSPAVFGGPASDSAIGQSVMARDAMNALYHAKEGYRRLYEETGSMLLEVGCAISETFDTPLPIARNQAVPIVQRGQDVSSTRAPIVLGHDDAGGVYEYTAIYKKQRGEDLAKRQQNVELVKQRLMTTRQFLEEDGDAAPELTEAAIAAEDLAKTPIVQQRRLLLAAQYAGDQEQAEMLRAVAQGLAAPNSTVEQPVPMGLLAGVPGPPGMGGGPPPSVPGVSLPNPGASQLAGIVSAGMQTGPIQQIGAIGGNTQNLPSPPTRSGG